ncbi:hypothetical protein BDZ89DRAFT_1129561 [Hymenopellis radicata]|nr:hypothetical protein BDZ89DRAFT_1129561 [Hymenopellis radicata]
MYAMRSVYSAYHKSLLTNENDHGMTTLQHSSRSKRRKGYAPHYVATLDNMGSKTPLALFRNLKVDVSGSTSHGYHLGATDIHDFQKRGILRSAIPTWAWILICKIPNARWRQMCDSDKIMAERTRLPDLRPDELDETERPLCSTASSTITTLRPRMPCLTVTHLGRIAESDMTLTTSSGNSVVVRISPRSFTPNSTKSGSILGPSEPAVSQSVHQGRSASFLCGLEPS